MFTCSLRLGSLSPNSRMLVVAAGCKPANVILIHSYMMVLGTEEGK